MAMMPNWTTAEEFHVLGQLEEGKTLEEISRQVGRTPTAIRDRCALLHASVMRARGMTLTQVANLMGVDQKAVAWWVNQGWLRHYDPNVRMGKGQVRVVSDQQLHRFLSNEQWWHLWEPERITDTGLRLWATEQRRGLTFMGVKEAGRILHMCCHSVNKAIRERRIRAVKHGPNWQIRSDWVHLPERRKPPRRVPLSDREKALIREWWGKKPATWIAEHLDRPRSGAGICRWAYSQGLPRLGRGTWKQTRV